MEVCYNVILKFNLLLKSRLIFFIFTGKRTSSSVLNSTPTPGLQCEIQLETSDIEKVATHSRVECNPRKSLRRLMALDSSSLHPPKKIDVFLKILDITEDCNNKRKPNDPEIPLKMFVSDTTLQAWRITVLSVISLTEKMFNSGYYTVLTGKLNQDPLEVIFGNLKIILCIYKLSVYFSAFLEL